MRYHEVIERSHDEIEILLKDKNSEKVTDALLSAAYYDPDWLWVQNQCLFFLNHADSNVRVVAATCLGHVARIHKKLDLEIVLSALVPLKHDPQIGPYVQDALDDIRFQLRFQ